MEKNEHRRAAIDNLLAEAFINAWRDGFDVETMVKAIFHPQNTPTGSHVSDLWLSTMLGN